MKETSTNKISGLIAVPVYNESGVLPTVIENLKLVLVEIPGVDLIFINDGSADQSAAILRQAGMTVINHPINLGYKEALRTAMVWAVEREYDFIVFFDADGQHRTEDLLKLIHTHKTYHDDLIIGSRFQGEQSRRFSFRRLGTSLFSRLTTRFSGVTVTDVTCGLKLITKKYLPVVLNLPAEDFHAELIMGLTRCGATVREVAIVVPERETGSSMYSIFDGVLYPARTLVCLLTGLLFNKRLTPLIGEDVNEPAK